MDQIACQNLSNSPRTIAKKSAKNILRQNPMRFSRTGIGVQSIKDLKPYIEKVKMSKKYEKANKKKIEEILEIVYKELLKPLKSIFKKETELIVVLDNYPVHHWKTLKESCKYLNITLIHLPPYSPKLNPIEQVWKKIKKELSSEFIVSEEFLIENFEKLFYENVDKKSFTDKWIDKFIFDKNNDLLIIDICEQATLII